MDYINNIDYYKFITEYNSKCPNYNYKPPILKMVDRIIVLGDIHGDYRLALNMLMIGKVIKLECDIKSDKIYNFKNIIWIGEQTHVVQVGDQIDKCRPDLNHKCDEKNGTYNDEQSDLKLLKLFTYLDQEAQKVGGVVFSLLGNHELMNVDGNTSYASYEGNMEFNNFIINGKTIKSGKKARKLAFKPGNEVGKFLGCSRYAALIIGSNLFVHAGIVNGLIKELNLDDKSSLVKIDMAIKMWLLGSVKREYIKSIIDTTDNSMFWTRILGKIPPNIPLTDSRCINHIDNVLRLFNVGSIIVGHTPQSFGYSDNINGTCGNAVWRVDNGSSEAFSYFDPEFLTTGKVQYGRRPQILEILDDIKFKVCYYDDNGDVICK